MNSISRFPENVTRKNPILTYLLMLDNNRHGNYSISLNVYSEYFHCVEERQLSRKKRGIKGRSEKNPIKYVVKKMVYLMMRKEYRVAKNYV